LQVSAIGHFANFPAEGIYLMNQLGLGGCTDGWVTGLPSDFVKSQCQQQGTTAQSCRRQGGFTTGVTGTNNNDIKAIEEFYRGSKGHGKRLSSEDSCLILAVGIGSIPIRETDALMRYLASTAPKLGKKWFNLFFLWHLWLKKG
jgi:hypothetical protein